MSAATIEKQFVILGRARGNLLLVVVVTAVNLFLAAFDSDLYFLFSASAPYLIFWLAYGFLEGFPEQTIFIVSLALALCVILPYLIYWLFARRRHFFIKMLSSRD